MKLFEPIKIGAMDVPNRIVFPPIASELAEEGGTVGDTAINYYARRAEGGAGMVIVEYTAVDDRRYSSHRQFRISDDSYVPGMRRLAQAIKAHGARAAIQIHHPGRQNYSSVTGLQPIAPSPIPCPLIKEMPLEMTVAEIEELIEKYAAAAARAREAGFDAVQVHGAHGYLVCQFLSPYSNKRTDEYGGDTVRRARFATAIIRRAKELAGSDFPIMLRISGDEHVAGGLTVPESQEIARLTIAAGADAIDVSAGNYAALEWSVQPQFWPRACLAPLAAALKPAVSVPLIIAGRINDAPIAERVLQEGNADMVVIGRGLIADPDLPRKALAGSSRVHRCITCNTCMDVTSRRRPIRCLINPEAGVEGQGEATAAVKRKVLVIGGGPSGMEAARIARLRGHEVALWEEAAKPDGPWAYLVGGFVKDRLQRLRELGVRVQLGHEVSVAAVAAARPDVALVSPRLVPRAASFPSAGTTRVLKADELLEGGSSGGHKVAVLGGGEGPGLAAAQAMLRGGAAVTVVEPGGRLGGAIESITRKTLLDRLQRDGLQVMLGATPVRLAEGGLVLSQKDGTETTLAVDTVVLAHGYDHDESLLAALQAAGIDARPLPACEAPRRAIDALEAGAAVARTI